MQITQHNVATLAGGCFWCMQPLFDPLPGVLATRVGYTGGTTPSPSYEQVCAGASGHVEAVQILFEAARISYATLLDVYWAHIDPTTSTRQFCDVGPQFCPTIFYHNADQHGLALESLARVRRRYPDKAVLTRIVPAGVFYTAEPYHQDYYRKYPENYATYLQDCGRDRPPGQYAEQ